MKFSVWPTSERSITEILDVARMADEDGWFGLWFADHYMPNTGDESFKPGGLLECWSVLPTVAAVTSRLRLGPLVTPTSIHHPALIANRAATIDHVSDGRFVLGLGAGWQINEHAAYGIELEDPGPRVSRFEESIQIVRSLLDNDRTTFDGDFYTFSDAPCDPKPVQETLPILVGTSSPRMLRITARHAQEWNAWGAPELAAESRSKFEDACADVGTDPASIHTSVQAVLVLTDDDAVAKKALDGPMGARTIAGSNDHVVEQLARYAENGFDEFIVFDGGLGRSTEERLDNFRRLHDDIVPQLA